MEFMGWRVGEKCQTMYLADGAKYPAVISVLKPATQSAVVTFVQYLNQQDTPLAFLERIEPPADALQADGKGKAAAGERAEKKRKTEIVIKPTDAPEVVERKKRLLKKQKREAKSQEKEKIQEKKVNHWKSFQNSAAAKRGGVKKTSIFQSSDTGTVGVVRGKAQQSGATGVRQKWTTADNMSLPDRGE